MAAKVNKEKEEIRIKKVSITEFHTYLKERGYSDNTIMNYMKLVKYDELLNNEKLNICSDIPEAAKTAILALSARKGSRGTLSPLRASYSLLMRFYGYPEPTIQAALPAANFTKGETRDSLSKFDLDKFLEASNKLKEPARTILLLLPRTGLRIGEITKLKKENVIIKNDECTISVKEAKGNKNRLVPLGKHGISIMKEYLELNPKKDGEYLFESKAGEHIKEQSIRKYTRSMGIDDLSPHVLRHTYATMLLRGGMDLKQLQKILGHESIKTTQRYLHPTTEDLSLIHI